MKKSIFILFAALFLITCSEYENPVKERGTYAAPLMSDPDPAYFTDNIEASVVKFDLSLPQGQSVDKAAIEVTSKGKSAIIKEISLPAKDVTVTASEVLSALSISVSDYNLGDVFFLYVLTTKNGVTTRSGAAFAIPVVCFFEPGMLTGKFYYISEDWDEEGSVTITADPNDPYTVYISGMAETQGLTGNGGRIHLKMNPANFSITGDRSVIANNLLEWDFPANYLDYNYTAMSGNYSACDDAYVLTFRIQVLLNGSYTGWGNFLFTFTRE